MAALIEFVDSISDDPTVRLNLNDGISWFCQVFKAPPPRLRRSESDNSMRDGGVVGSSSYGNRTLELDLTLIEEGDEEWAAQEMQRLWRELDRPQNFIRYWPEGLDKPVFFRTFRSDVSELEELWTTPIARNISLEILAEPFALGLRETLGPYAVNNDPADGSNGLRFTIPAEGALGDVPAPFLAAATSGSDARGVWLASGAPVIVQAEDCGFGANTTNPGGGPDSAMSGTATNNYITTSFGTASMVQRLQTPFALLGLYRVAVIVRRSDATSVFTARAASTATGVVGDAIAIPLTTSRQVVDLGVIHLGTRTEVLDYSHTALGAPSLAAVQAARASGAGTLQWDALLFIPVDRQFLMAEFGTARLVSVDSASESVVGSTSNLLAGGAVWEKAEASGGFPAIFPAVDNTFAWIHQTAELETHSRSAAIALSVYYHPQYLFIRPSTS